MRDSMSVLKRVMSYMLKYYKFRFCAVVVFIIVSAFATVRSMMFTQVLIDDYIVPMLASAAPDFAPLLRNLMQVGAVMLIGVIAAFAYNRIMVGISQGTMRRLRIDIFSNMESLPIKYFDTTAHGDIMSV